MDCRYDHLLFYITIAGGVMSIDAMKAALEALDLVYEQVDFSNGVTDPTGTMDEGKVVIGGIIGAAIATLRQAIEQAEKQEPVAWYAQDNLGDEIEVIWNSQKPTYAEVWIPLYAAPPKREWVGLTDEEITEYSSWLSGRNVVRAIEQRLKEKNT